MNQLQVRVSSSRGSLGRPDGEGVGAWHAPFLVRCSWLEFLESFVPLWDVAQRVGAPKLTFEVTACSLARQSGDGVLTGARGPSAPRQSEVATRREEEKL
jgi:hypothetical protein